MDSWLGRLLNGIVAVVLVVGIIIAIVWAVGTFRKQKAEEEAAKGPSKQMPKAVVTLKPPVQKAAEGLNLSVIRREIARLRDEEEKLKRAEVAAAQAASQLDAERKKLKETRRFEHLKVQDKVVAVQGNTIQSLPPAEGAEYLQKTFSEIKPKSFFRIEVERGAAKRTLVIYFMNPSGLSDVSADLPKRVKFPHELGQRVQDEFFSMPEPYRRSLLTQEERQRLVRLLGAGEGSSEDYLFIKQRVLGEAVTAIRKEQEEIRTRLGELRAKIESSYGDQYMVVLQRSGLRMEGTKVSDTKGTLVLNTPLGDVQVRSGDIKEKCNGIQLRSSLAFHCYAIDRNLSAGETAIRWSDKWQLSLHRQYIGLYVLSKDPGNALARAAAGYRKKGATWVYDSSSAASTLFGTPETEKELREHLESRGFMCSDGKWHKRVPWSAKIDSLHDPIRFNVAFKRAGVLERKEGETPLLILMGEAAKLEIGNRRKERFIGAVSSNNQVGSYGKVTIEIPLPGAVASCKLKAKGYVFTKGGLLSGDEHLNRITVSVMNASGKAAEVYSIDRGADSIFYDITAHVKGMKKVTIVATLENTPDKFGTYVRFLRSFPGDRDSLVLQAQILEHSPEADELWVKRR